MQRKRQFMTDEVWETILNKYVLPYKDMNRFCPPTVILHKDSEPLIDKGLPKKLTDIAALAPDLKIDIYSNGVLLPKWRDRGVDFMEVLAALPNRVRYLMSYHPVNHDGTINDYNETVLYMKSVLRDPPPNVEFITTSHRSKHVSEAAQESWKLTWNGLPITVHCNCSINPWTGRIEEDATGDGKLARFNGCPYGDFGHTFFGCTGNVIACCLDLEEEIVFGNVMVDSPADMMSKLESFYADQRAGIVKYPVCANCFNKERSDIVQLDTGKLAPA